MSVDNEHEWNVALRGLERFFDEGMVLWSKRNFDLLFSSENVANSSYVLNRLKDLDEKGVISFVGSNNLYVKVLKI